MKNEREGLTPTFIIGVLSIVLLLVVFKIQIDHDKKIEGFIEELNDRCCITKESDRNILDNF